MGTRHARLCQPQARLSPIGLRRQHPGARRRNGIEVCLGSKMNSMEAWMMPIGSSILFHIKGVYRNVCSWPFMSLRVKQQLSFAKEGDYTLIHNLETSCEQKRKPTWNLLCKMRPRQALLRARDLASRTKIVGHRVRQWTI